MADIVNKMGSQGACLIIPGVPDSTFITEIAALIAAGTKPVGKLCSLTWGANYEVTSPADGAIPDGEIIKCEPTTSAAGNSYLLSVALFHYVDQNSAHHTPVCIRQLEYAEGATVAFQDSIIINGDDYRDVDDGTTGGWGAIIAIDTTNFKIDVIF